MILFLSSAVVSFTGREEFEMHPEAGAVSALCFVFVFLLTDLSGARGGSICPPLPYSSLPNGKIIVTGLQRFRFICDDGFFLGGPSQIRCLKGNWTSTKVPMCVEVEGRCDPPTPIPNGNVLGGDSNKVGSVVQYICHHGYVLVGNGRRACMRGGGWSGGLPACMSEAEPLQNIAERLDSNFIQKMESFSKNDSVQVPFHLDENSLLQGLELIVLIDRSSSVDPHDLKIGKNFLKFLFEEFNIRNGINPVGARAAVVAFGTEVDIIFNLDNASIDSSEAAGRALDDQLLPGGGGTAMVPAFAAIFVHIEPLFRKNAKKALFLVTDGEPNIGGEGASPEDMADDLEEYFDFEIFAMGIGSSINRKLLADVASEPVANHVFLLKEYKDLTNLMSIIRNREPEVPPISSDKCGHFNEDDKGNEWPWLAAVYASMPGQEAEVNGTSTPPRLKLCAGALICSQWVLTAASCFTLSDGGNASVSLNEVFVVLGERSLSKFDRAQENFYAIDVVQHPDFDISNEFYDNVALVKLHQPVKLDIHRTVCLPPTDRIVPMHTDLSLNVSVAGWGMSSPPKSEDEVTAGSTKLTLGSKEVVQAGDSECRLFMRRKWRKSSSSKIFCVEATIPNQCTGIPGSPLVAKNPATGIHHLFGVVTERSSCHKGYSYSVELTKYVKWINDVTDKCHFRHWN